MKISVAGWRKSFPTMIEPGRLAPTFVLSSWCATTNKQLASKIVRGPVSAKQLGRGSLMVKYARQSTASTRRAPSLHSPIVGTIRGAVMLQRAFPGSCLYQVPWIILNPKPCSPTKVGPLPDPHLRGDIRSPDKTYIMVRNLMSLNLERYGQRPD